MYNYHYLLGLKYLHWNHCRKPLQNQLTAVWKSKMKMVFHHRFETQLVCDIPRKKKMFKETLHFYHFTNSSRLNTRTCRDIWYSVCLIYALE